MKHLLLYPPVNLALKLIVLISLFFSFFFIFLFVRVTDYKLAIRQLFTAR